MYAQYTLYCNSQNNKDIKWCKLAAEQGHVEAQNRLAKCYEVGIGVTVDYAEAFKWFRRAAEQGSIMAVSALARCYYLGQGVQRDRQQAAIWYAKAAGQDNVIAKRYMDLCSL